MKMRGQQLLESVQSDNHTFFEHHESNFDLLDEVYENEEENFRRIDCDLYGAEFIVFPIGPGPFFEVFSLEAICPAELDPETMCTQFNKV